jgi:oligoribonuclease NrnB/cAMP/cGMP phosphodiesterase (DHH superfamily)
MATERTIVLYHGNCPDGFGGAYAAWKKFGDAADYVPLARDVDPPFGFEGAHLYFIDFCYPQEIMDRYIAEAAKVTVLDHHEGVEEVITRMPEYRYTSEHSGSVIAWKYFHPDTPVPMLLQYVETGDLYKFTMPDAQQALAYLYTRPQSFLEWDALREQMDDTEGRARIVELGRSYAEHKQIVVEQIMKQAELVDFEGHRTYLASCSKQFTSPVGNQLAQKLPPLALIASVHSWGLRVSLRSDGTLDVSELARKFGGNGHPYAAAFSLKWSDSIPWSPVQG